MRRRLTVLAFLLVLAPGGAFAADVAWVELEQDQINAPVIEVAAKAYGYTRVLTNRLTWRLTRSAACPGCGEKTSSLFLKRLSTGERFFVDYEVPGGSVFDYTTQESANLTGLEKLGALGACRQFLEEQMAAGKSKAWVLNQDHTLSGPTLYEARHEVEVLYGGDGSKTIDLTNPIRCKRSPVVIPDDFKQPSGPRVPPGPQDMRQVFGVQSAVLSLTPEQATVVTQAVLQVRVEVRANGPGTVKHRVVHNGGKGPVNTLKFGKAGTKVLKFPLTVKCPKDGQQEAQPSGGIGGMTAAPPGTRNGYVRLEITSPNALVSNDGFYSVTCKKTGTLVTPLPDLVLLQATIRREAAARDLENKPRHRGLELAVRNQGAAGAASSKLRVKASTGDTFTATIPALAAGDKTTIGVDFGTSLPAGTTYQVRLDSMNQVAESNEGNNVSTVP